MNTRYLLLALILIVPIAAAENLENYNSYGSLEITVSEEASFIAEPDFEGGAIRIDSMDVNLGFFPKDSFNQVILNQEAYGEPEAQVSRDGNKINFIWKDSRENKLKMHVDSRLKTINSFPRINHQIMFPRESQEENEYLASTEFIDITDEITQQATTIIDGQRDYYMVAFKLAEWVNGNIEYSLNTLTEEVVQPASWVLENKQGVCDELTNLYIAFLRSVGIPARFVAGQVYSNVNYKFGNHGWAEVFFPEIGWVPVDVTFNQIGWIDPSHIKFQTELDPNEPSYSYSLRSIGTKMTANPLFLETKVTKTLGENPIHAELEIEPLKEEAGPGSFIPIKVTIKNLEDYYLPSIVEITTAPNLTESNRKAVLLKPKEEKEVFWISQMPADLEENYLYETRIGVISSFSKNVSSSIKLSRDYESFDEKWAEERVSRLSPRESKSFFPNLKMECSLDNDYYYLDEVALVKCSIQNQGNTNFNFIKACYETNCYNEELRIGQKKEFEWKIKIKELQGPEIKITAESQDLIKEEYLMSNIIRVPKIEVHDLEPKKINYSDEGELYFIVSSNFTAYNVSLKIPNYGHSSVNRVLEKKALALPFKGKDFKRGKIELELTYYDKAGKRYFESHNFDIEVINLPWYEKVILWVEKLLS